ncbi:MAG: (deoxy)nucleoside triphosphate pyrophosphohydrolase [Ignavibacteria bacterium]|nr:(deoxy)nucleoside triphosphate pyrophosphohydrolase [Ignavibacteria bacterium]
MKEVAVGILIRNNRILVCQRKETSRYPLKWEFPGGKLEKDETAVDALKRELKEELGIDAEIGNEFHRQEWQYDAEPAADGHSFRIFYYLVPEHHGSLRNRAFREVRWVTPEELPAMDLLEGNREAVQRLIRDGRPITSRIS